jgi:hypothetical protein
MKTLITIVLPLILSLVGIANAYVFDDEFDGSALDTTQWTVISRHGEYSQSETECNVPGAVSVANGYLTITTTAQSATCGDFNPNGTQWHAPASWPYTTGDIQWKSKSFTYGTVEIRGQFPSSNTNLWPAFWLLGSNCQATNPMTGETGVGNCPNINTTGYTEIDMVECYNSGGWCQFHVANPGFGIGGGCDATFAVDTNWHTWDTVWTSSSIKLYMDGTLITTCNQSMSNPMFLIIQTQTGGTGGTPNNSYLPANLNVDYVRVINTIQVGSSGAYSTIQSAYNAARDEDTIEVQAGTYVENDNLNGSVSVTVIGGYDSSFATNSSYSVINGTLIISNGTVTVENIIIQ